MRKPVKSNLATTPVPSAPLAAATCPHCAAPVSATDLFCSQCGRDRGTSTDASAPSAVRQQAEPPAAQLASDPVAPPAAPAEDQKTEATPAAPSPDTAGRIVCPCGQPAVAEALFCHRCGKAVSPPKPRCQVIRLGPDRKGESLAMSGDELTIGKAPGSGLIIEDGYVSRRHARLAVSDGKLVVEDLNSSNGTFVRVRRPFELQTGDEILVGANVLKVEEVSL